MAKSKQAKGADELVPEGASEPEKQPEPASQPDPLDRPMGIPREDQKPQSRATGAAQGQGVTHFQKLASDGGGELQFTTEEQLAKYNQDVRTINNMQLEDPTRFQAEHGYWPKRGDTTIPKHGLTPQDFDDVITAKKKLEGPDDQGNFKAIPVN